MKHVHLNAAGQSVNLAIGDGCGRIESGLERKTCPYCNQWNCNFSCDESQSAADDDEVIGRLAYNAGLDVIEALVLGHAIAGVDVEDTRYLRGLEATLEEMDDSI